MEWASVTAREAISRFKRGARGLDVRSPGEFFRGHLPKFTNVAILDDEQRHAVGLRYKQQGQDAAIALGLDLVLPLKAQRLQLWSEALRATTAEDRILICWRGGLRSKISAQWLREAGMEGVRVVGGYKAMRAILLEAQEKAPALFALGGLTGAGKTDLLRGRDKTTVLDLELYANHRGSSFGLRLDSAQPQQQTFENEIGLAFFESPPNMVVEAESRMIGKCVIPNTVKAAMDRSPMVLLECGMDDRVRRIFSEYVQEPLSRAGRPVVHEHLRAALERTQRRLGGLRHQEILAELNHAFTFDEVKLDRHAAWIESLLREYYDPLYAHSLTADEERIVFRGGFDEVKAYLAARLDRRRA